MPKYKVTARGFHDGVTYDPKGKRTTLFVEKAFKSTPSWLEPMKAETAAEQKKREAEEKKKAKADKDGIDADKADIDAMSFIGEGESAVTTL